MKHLALLALFVISTGAIAQDSTLDLGSGRLMIHSLVAEGVDETYAVELKGNSDYSSFQLLSAEPVTPEVPRSGVYAGSVAPLKPGSATEVQECALELGATDRFTLTIEETAAGYELDSSGVWLGRCLLKADGAYQCSDFDSGTWSLVKAVAITPISLYLIINLRGGECEYDSHYQGFLTGGDDSLVDAFSQKFPF